MGKRGGRLERSRDFTLVKKRKRKRSVVWAHVHGGGNCRARSCMVMVTVPEYEAWLMDNVN